MNIKLQNTTLASTWQWPIWYARHRHNDCYWKWTDKIQQQLKLLSAQQKYLCNTTKFKYAW